MQRARRSQRHLRLHEPQMEKLPSDGTHHLRTATGTITLQVAVAYQDTRSIDPRRAASVGVVIETPLMA